MALPTDDEESEDLDARFLEMAAVAWPDLADDEDRLAAAKEAIRACVQKDKAGAYGAPPGKGGMDVAIMMAPGKGKK